MTLRFFATSVPRGVNLLFHFCPFNRNVSTRLLNRTSSKHRSSTTFLNRKVRGNRIRFRHIRTVVFRCIRQKVTTTRVIRPSFRANFPRATRSLTSKFVLGSRNVFHSFQTGGVSKRLMSERNFFRRLYQNRRLRVRTKGIRKCKRNLLTSFRLVIRGLDRLIYSVTIRPISRTRLFRHESRRNQQRRAMFQEVPTNRNLRATCFTVRKTSSKLAMRLSIVIFGNFIRIFPRVILRFIGASRFSNMSNVVANHVLNSKFTNRDNIVIRNRHRNFQVQGFARVASTHLRFGIEVNGRILCIVANYLSTHNRIYHIDRSNRIVNTRVNRRPT